VSSLLPDFLFWLKKLPIFSLFELPKLTDFRSKLCTDVLLLLLLLLLLH
jgi:hypothetical protein